MSIRSVWPGIQRMISQSHERGQYPQRTVNSCRRLDMRPWSRTGPGWWSDRDRRIFEEEGTSRSTALAASNLSGTWRRSSSSAIPCMALPSGMTYQAT
jgi:hypothetical protein